MTVTLSDDEFDFIAARIFEIDTLLVMLGKVEGKDNARCPMTDKVTSKLYEIGNMIYAAKQERVE